LLDRCKRQGDPLRQNAEPISEGPLLILYSERRLNVHIDG
jgi:hypothetical protein